MVLFYIGAPALSLYRRPELGGPCYNPAARRTNRSVPPPMALPARRLLRLLPLAVAVALLGLGLVLAAGAPVAAQVTPKNTATVDGTADFKWNPANVSIRPGGTVTFKVTGSPPHPVKSGDGSNLNGDGRFDDSKCGVDQMSKVGASCQIKFPKAGTYPFFCQVHVTQGMKGVIQVGTSGGGAPTTTAAGGEAGGSVVEPPSAAAPPSPGRPAIYWAGWGLFVLGALLALVVIALYVRFAPGFNRPKR
jgi:plastocyanin